MSGIQKIILAGTSLLVLVVVASFIMIAVNDVEFFGRLAPGTVFKWDNFDPFTRSGGALGLSPLIWTALVALPVSLLVPMLVYLYEKKRVRKPVRVILALTRTSALIVLYLLIAGPSLITSETYVESSKVAVLLDDSLSMGAESREFPIFNVLDDSESADVRKLRQELGNIGIVVPAPKTKGYVTLTEDELLVRNFVREVVLKRAKRLLARLNKEYGKDFDIDKWQKQRRIVDLTSKEADLKQSELNSEEARETPDLGHVRVLKAKVQGLLAQVSAAQDSFAEMLGGSLEEQVIRDRQALVNNLLETVNKEGPRRWDIACELLVEGSTLAMHENEKISILDLVKRKAAQTDNSKEDSADSENAHRMPILRFFVFSTRYGRKYMTDEAIVEIKREEIDYREPNGRLTEIDTALEQVRRYYSEEDDLSAILVVTDGRDTSPEKQDPRTESGLESSVAVSFIAIGNPKPVKVLELLSVNADAEVLKGDFVDFKLKIRADKAYQADPKTGKPGIKVKIILCEDGSNNEVMYSEINGKARRSELDQYIEIGASELTDVRIRYKPSKAGRRIFQIKVNKDRLPDEDTYKNNVRKHEILINDRKLKVLYLEQRARWLWRWLNASLKSDKALAYHGYLFNADSGWGQPTSIYTEAGEDGVERKVPVKPLLSPFPTGSENVTPEQAFYDLDYDVIIIGDVNTNGADFKDYHWKWLDEWVSRHRGGLIFLAGESYNPSSYVNSEYAKSLYPIELDVIKNSGAGSNTSQLFYNLTPAGRAHEVHRMSSNAKRNADLWGRIKDGRYKRGSLNPVYWAQPQSKIKPAPAVVLARASRDGQKGNTGEILTATMPYGNGTVLYLGTDDQWYWREFHGDHYFYRYFQNSIRFVASRRLAGKQRRVDVYTDKNKYQVSETVKIYVELMGNIYDEVIQNQIKDLSELPNKGRGGENSPRNIIVDIKARTQGRMTSRHVVLSEVVWSPNVFEGVIQANTPGLYDVFVRGNEETMKVPHRYRVIAPIAEISNMTMDMAGMISRASKIPEATPALEYQAGKRIWNMTDAGKVSLDVRQKQNEIKGMSKLIWNRQKDSTGLRSILLIFLLLLLAGEWLNRKLLRMV